MGWRQIVLVAQYHTRGFESVQQDVHLELS
jgi:hypothetical protein